VKLRDGLPRDLNRSVFRSTSAQVGGRFVLSLARLVVAALVVRSFGPDRYGEYSLVLVLTAIPEWIVDFGLNDIFVREISRQPERRERLLHSLAAAKMIQVAAAYAVLTLILLAMGYSASVTRASLIAGTALLFHGGILVYRALFKATLTLERDTLAETAGVVAMLPLLWAACVLHARLEVLALCHVFSRLVYLGAALALGSGGFPPRLRAVAWPEVEWGFRQAAAIGVAGFVVGIFEAADVLVLSKMAPAAQVGFFSGAQKVVWPILTGMASIGMTVFPVLSSYYGRQPERFRCYFQGSVDAVIVLSALLLSGVAGGAEFLVGLLGPAMLPAAPLLRVFAVIFFAKIITTTVGPVLYVTGAQKYALWITGTATALKIGVLLALVPRYGAMGAVVGCLVVEVFAGLVPTVLVVEHFARCRLQWTMLGRVAAALLPAHGAVYLLGVAGTLPGGILAASLFALFAVVTGALRPREIRALIARPPIEAAVLP
jgi:O-antigen/teichoic acid export membrane protein